MSIKHGWGTWKIARHSSGVTRNNFLPSNLTTFNNICIKKIISNIIQQPLSSNNNKQLQKLEYNKIPRVPKKCLHPNEEGAIREWKKMSLVKVTEIRVLNVLWWSNLRKKSVKEIDIGLVDWPLVSKKMLKHDQLWNFD